MQVRFFPGLGFDVRMLCRMFGMISMGLDNSVGLFGTRTPPQKWFVRAIFPPAQTIHSLIIDTSLMPNLKSLSPKKFAISFQVFHSYLHCPPWTFRTHRSQLAPGGPILGLRLGPWSAAGRDLLGARGDPGFKTGENSGKIMEFLLGDTGNLTTIYCNIL